MNKIPSLQDRLLESRRILAQHSPPVGLMMEYVRNAEFTLRVKRVGSALLYVYISCTLLMMLCQVNPTLKTLFFEFFRWILLPIKPILLSARSAEVAALIVVLSTISQWVLFLVVPALVYATFVIGFRRTFLYLEGDTLMLLQQVLSSTAGGTGFQSRSYREFRYIQGKSFALQKSVFIGEGVSATVERPVGKKSYRDYVLRLEPTAKEPVASQTVVLRWGDIVKADDRNQLLEELERRLPDLIDRTVFEPFKQVTTRQSYTEIWLKELSGAPKRDRLTPLLPGSLLDRGNYTVLERAGVGGQGTVYFADSNKHSGGSSRLVVLKEFVLPVYPDIRVRKKAAERFQTEASMLSRLDHRQIVKFIDLFVEDHRAYVVMELVEGTTLKERVAAEGPLSEGEVIQLAAQMAEVLTYLAAQSPAVVHRDITPDNIILGVDGVPKLIDFSVAQELSSGVTGSVVGKPNYISPEQFRGKPTVQSDIYSLGATLYFLLVGQDPPPITVLHPNAVQDAVSMQIDHIIARCTQLDVLKRYQSATDLLADLKNIQSSI